MARGASPIAASGDEELRHRADDSLWCVRFRRVRHPADPPIRSHRRARILSILRRMPTSPRSDLANFPNSPYAAELQRGGGSRAFSPEIEAEYARSHLRDNRSLI